MTTLGYGDIIPKTYGGRAVGVFLMFSGISLLSLITAIIASILVERKIREEKGLESIKSSGHIVICGWNENGFEILEGIKLSDSIKKEVVLINELGEEAINDLKFKYKDDLDIKYIKGDFASESALQRANIQDANSVILLSDAGAGQNPEKADARLILAALAVKSLAPNVRLSAELLKKENETHLKRARADEIVVRGEHSGFFLASSSLTPGIPEVVKELLSFREGNDLKRTPILPQFVGKTFKELFHHFRDRQKSILIGLVSESKAIGLDDILSHDFSAVDEFIKQKFQEAGEDFFETGTKGVYVNLNPDDGYIIKENELAVIITPRGK